MDRRVPESAAQFFKRQISSLASLATRERIPEAAAVALALILALAIWLGTRYVMQAEWIRHTLEVQSRISSIWSHLQDAEIGQRSFVLTGDDRFIAPFVEANERLDPELDVLGKLVADNADQVAAVAEVRPLVVQRLEVARRTVALRRQGDFEGARAQVLEGRGLSLMQDLRGRFQRMQEGEALLLRARTAAADTTIELLSIAILLTVGFAAAALAYWIMNTRRAAETLALANTALQNSIAERDSAEQQVRQMQKMESIGQLAGGIAHDFNNMLAVITSGISLARRRMAPTEKEADGFLGSALEGAHKAATLVRRLLAFSRQQPLAPEAIDANKFVAGMSELIARSLGESVRMETVLGGGLWPTLVDPAQLETSVLNLCVNARDAMPEGGRLTLETANCHLDDRYSRLHPGVPPGQYVLIAVSDTGTGMSSEVAAKAFDPFFTTKETGKGTGLGLSQVFGFVKQSGGHVKIYSEVGQGTTIKIYLPRHYGEASDRQALGQPRAENPRGSEIILLVEDDANVLALTATGLRDLGYTVIEARHANEALAQLRNGAKIDLLLTDIIMPDVSGRKLADQAVTVSPDLKVLFMTGFTRNAVVHNGVLDAGVHFLAKPFTLEELSRKVREALETTVKA
jgi:signal transduction histidine kinase/ActR/RegA family two-component response regulator